MSSVGQRLPVAIVCCDIVVREFAAVSDDSYVAILQSVVESGP